MTSRTFTITVDGRSAFGCEPEVSVLVAMGRHGIRAIAAGCHGGGCGICRIRVESGLYETRRMSRAHVTETAEASGVALACRTYPRSDLVVSQHPLWPSLRLTGPAATTNPDQPPTTTEEN